MIKFKKIYYLLLLSIFITSCNEAASTANICADTCENNGVKISECDCECTEGFAGTTCEGFDSQYAQKLLDDGINVKDLVEGGVPRDSIYGKIYNEGYIFLIDDDLEFFKITASIDASTKLNWNDAKEYCTNLEMNNITNWELPNLGDLYLVYENLYLNEIGGFKDEFYWSSTEESATEAYAIFFLNSNEGIIPKDDFNGFSLNYVRAISQIDL